MITTTVVATCDEPGCPDRLVIPPVAQAQPFHYLIRHDWGVDLTSEQGWTYCPRHHWHGDDPPRE